MITGSNITKRFGDRVLFDHLNFVIEDGNSSVFPVPAERERRRFCIS